mgnify:CR=1 FL=1
MSIPLRTYQSELIGGVSRSLKVHRKVLLQSATGSGKTLTSATMIHNSVRAGWRVMFLCHRIELVDQTSKTMTRLGVDHSFVANGFPQQYKMPVLICMVQTLCKRIEKVPAPNLIVIDECHHAVSSQYRKVLEAYPDALVVGLTATPERLDGRGLDDIFNALVPGPSIRWLMDQGYLSDYRLWSHQPPKVEDLKKRGGDYDAHELSDVMRDSKLVGDAVEHYLDLCPGERGVAFCVDVEHATKMADAFQAAGVRAVELDGTAPADVRKKTIRAFREGDIDILTSVDLFGEGFDLPEMSVALLCRPTQSLGLALQQVGRTFRTVYADGYDLETQQGRLDAIANGPKPFARILDHAGNFGPHRPHGMPDDDREWTLEGRKKRASTSSGPAPKGCPRCFGANPSGTKICRYCSFAFVLTPREIEIEAGDLVEIQREQARVAVASQTANDARSYDEVVTIMIARGHNDPATAAEAVWRKRGEPVTEQQFYDACKRVSHERRYKNGWAEFRVRMRRDRIKALAEKQKNKVEAA